MGSEYMGPSYDPNTQQHQSFPTNKPSVAAKNDAMNDKSFAQGSLLPNHQHNNSQSLPPREAFPEPVYREHVSGALTVPSSEAPNFRPAYPPYQASSWPQVPQGQGYPPRPAQQYQPGPSYPAYPGYQGYPGYPPYGWPTNYAPQYTPAYPGYSPYAYPYAWQPPKPKRDGYLLAVSITSFIGAILATLAGLGSALFLLLVAILPTRLPADQELGAIVLFFALAFAGIAGGGFSLYHSIRSLFVKRPSADFKLPWFWIFLVLYLGVIAFEGILLATGQINTNAPQAVFLISLAGLLPALTILALGVRRVHYPKEAKWPTTWRRFTLAIVSGATSAIVLALIFELTLTAFITQQLGLTGFSIDNPNQPIPQDPRVIGLLFIILSVIAPLVEETVKPLAVVVLVGRIQSATEAFVLGLSCGIGFDLVETSGYISMGGYHDWLGVALERSTAGLLHGFGAAMVSLGWYYITHPKSIKNRVPVAIGCWAYALLQHAIWNGSFGLQLLPAPIGPYLDKGTIPLGSLELPSFILVYIIESLLMLTFFLIVTGKLRGKKRSKLPMQPSSTLGVSTPEASIATRV